MTTFPEPPAQLHIYLVVSGKTNKAAASFIAASDIVNAAHRTFGSDAEVHDGGIVWRNGEQVGLIFLD